MTDLVFPRWVHREGKTSQVANDAEQMKAIEAAWDAESAPIEPTYTAADLTAAWAEGVNIAIKTAQECGASEELLKNICDQFDAGVIQIEPSATDIDADDLLPNPLTSAAPRRGRPRKDS